MTPQWPTGVNDAPQRSPFTSDVPLDIDVIFDSGILGLREKWGSSRSRVPLYSSVLKESQAEKEHVANNHVYRSYERWLAADGGAAAGFGAGSAQRLPRSRVADADGCSFLVSYSLSLRHLGTEHRNRVEPAVCTRDLRCGSLRRGFIGPALGDEKKFAIDAPKNSGQTGRAGLLMFPTSQSVGPVLPITRQRDAPH